MKKEKPKSSAVYHVYNRGVEKRIIFLDDDDRFRFIHDLYEFNDSNPAFKYFGSSTSENKGRDVLVEILAFCMMPNHYHLMLRQVSENGITEFMRKIGTGYTNYFNKKYERVGSLFQGRYKMMLMKNEGRYINLPQYIHLNPLKIVTPGIKENGTKNFKKALNFLRNYRWSSYRDYIGIKNFPSLLNKKFMSEIYGSPKDYQKSILARIKQFGSSTSENEKW